MTGNDPFDMFSQLDPSRQLDPADIEQRNADVLRHVLQQPGPVRSARRSRRAPWLIGGLCVAVAATAAFAFIRSSEVSNPLAISCMAANDTNSDIVALGSAADPVAACREVWERGDLGNGDVPDLAACVNDAGTAMVFPSDRSICGRLGLAELEPGLDDTTQAIAAVEQALVATFAGDCFDQAAAIDEAQRQLDASGLDGWSVNAPEPFPTDAPCAVPGLDVDARQVVVIGGRSR